MKRFVNYLIYSICTVLLMLCMSSCYIDKTQSDKDVDVNHKVYSSALSVNNNVLNLGEINKSINQSVTFDFILNNESDSIISIDKVDVSCSCLKVTSYPEVISPAQSGTLKGVINLENQTGHIRKSIFINYCDSCLTVLKIIADITE